VNRRAGAGSAAGRVEEMRRLAGDVGLHATVSETDSGENLEKIVGRLAEEGVGLVAIAGGDGTVSRAVQHLVHTQTALGILPLGTANNFAAAMRLPLDLPSAMRVLKEGRVREVDLGRAGDCHFLESAGVGIFADSLVWYGE